MILPDRGDPPSFQSVAELNVFLHSNHKNMPNLILSRADSDDVIAYIVSLKQQ
jgi:hypothetical protein